ncbi:SOS response-associated peptidase [soil metagenome]
MCYDISYMTKKAVKYANYYGFPVEEVEEYINSIFPGYHASAFTHPDIPVVTNESPHKFQSFTWGLIPPWVKDPATAAKMQVQTLNARGENIFEKPAFRAAAANKRCLVVVDGFFEHHWFNKNAYPFYIKMKNDDPFSLAGLWENWWHQGIERNTVSIVTTAANALMTRIHNKPKASEGHRMPLIVPRDLHGEWLKPINDPLDKQSLTEMIRAYDEEELVAFTVPKLRGKSAVGNNPEACGEVKYQELIF